MKTTQRISVSDRQVKQAKAMRAALTEPERKLWRSIRQRLPIVGTHFRRQVSIGPYIVDFCCIGAKLVVEVDGNQHGTDDARAYDARRNALIESHGFRVIRFANEDVMTSTDAVLDTIFMALTEQLTEVGQAEGPPPPIPPRKGEGRSYG